MAWAMTSRVVPGPPKRLEFYIGAVRIAQIHWSKGMAILTMDETGCSTAPYVFKLTSEAMVEMHRRLGEPPDFIKQEGTEC